MLNLELLITVHNEYELGVISNILKSGQISFTIKDNGIGGCMRIYSGSSIYGTDILVAEENLERARELIANFISDADDSQNE